MTQHLPSNVALAVADPKVAPLPQLERALGFFSDEIHPDALDLVAAEYTRRTGSDEYAWHGDSDYDEYL